MSGAPRPARQGGTGGSRLGGLVLPGLTGAGLLVAWEIAWRVGVLDPLFFSGPAAVAATLARLLWTGEILPHYGVTMVSAALGVVLAVAAGIVAGIAYGLSPAIRAVAGPYLAALNATPRVATIGLLVIWLGLGMGVRVAMVAVSAFFPVFFNVVEGVRALDPALDRVGRAFGCTHREWFTRILLPHLVPSMLTGLQLALGRGLVVVVIAEIFVGSLGGVGYVIATAGQQVLSAQVFAGALLMAVTGCALTLACRWLGSRLTPWHRG